MFTVVENLVSQLNEIDGTVYPRMFASNIYYFIKTPLILINIGPGNVLVLVLHQAATSINDDLLSIEPLGEQFTESWMKTQND